MKPLSDYYKNIKCEISWEEYERTVLNAPKPNFDDVRFNYVYWWKHGWYIDSENELVRRQWPNQYKVFE